MMKVLKFGGTSVGSPERMKKLLDIIRPETPRLVVLSAVSGTTNKLVEIASFFEASDKNKAVATIEKLRAEYDQFIAELFATEQGLADGKNTLDYHFGLLESIANDLFTSTEEKIILAQGELISTTLFHYYLKEIGVHSVLLPALDFMKVDEDHEPMVDFITEHITPLLAQKSNLYITQGYICRNAYGQIDNLRRGGSDYTASLIGAAIRSEEVQIWTDIDGMHNNDPRIVDQTRPVEQLSFEEAAELAYFGAKILHPASIWPAQQAHVPVKLLNTMQPDAQGTLIADEARGVGVKAVAAKDNIWAIRIKSSRMLLAYGFLRRVFEVYEKYRTPIDMVTTSEVAVSLTIDSDQYLTEILEELRQFGSVEVDADQTIVSVVGQGIAKENGVLQQLFKAIGDIPVRMVSHGGSPHNISLLVAADRKKELLQQLNRGLFGL
jgi:aspartate kinase